MRFNILTYVMSITWSRAVFPVDATTVSLSLSPRFQTHSFHHLHSKITPLRIPTAIVVQLIFFHSFQLNPLSHHFKFHPLPLPLSWYSLSFIMLIFHIFSNCKPSPLAHDLKLPLLIPSSSVTPHC